MTIDPQDLADDFHAPRLIWVGLGVEVYEALPKEPHTTGRYFEIVAPCGEGPTPLALIAALGRLPETAKLRDAFNTGDDISFNFLTAV